MFLQHVIDGHDKLQMTLVNWWMPQGMMMVRVCSFLFRWVGKA